VFENMLIEGFGGVEITVRRLKNGAIDPYVVRIAQNRLYFDPHSSEAGFHRRLVHWLCDVDGLRRGGP
jgi:hypothetical protein